MVVNLTNEYQVLRRFDHHKLSETVIGERIVKGRHLNSDAVNDDHASKSDSRIATITRMAVSVDGQWLATADDKKRIHVFNLDSLQHHSLLPSFPRTVNAFAFSSAMPALLILGFSNNSLELWDVEARQTPAWARGFCDFLPKRFTHLHDPIIGVALPPPSSTRSNTFVLFWGATWLCRVDFSSDIGSGAFDKKRRWRNGQRQHIDNKDNFKMFTQYRQILLADFLSERELAVVERPLIDVLSTLPPAFFKYRYGAT
jgi:U3 small nucleolar RNA-associated protein 4